MKGYTLIEIMATIIIYISGILAIAWIGSIIFVGVHFIKKFW